MSTTQITGVCGARVTPRFAGLVIKTWGGRTITSIRPKNDRQPTIITAMNPGESVVYQEKACIVLDATSEGFPLPQEHVLLEELTHYSASRGRVRHLAHLNDVNQGGEKSLPENPAA